MDTEDNTFSFQMPEKGTLVLQETVAVYLNGLGTWDRYRPTTTLEKVSDEYEAPALAPAKARMTGKADIRTKKIR